MSDLSQKSKQRAPGIVARFSLDSCAVALATAFVLLIIAGALPRVPW